MSAHQELIAQLTTIESNLPNGDVIAWSYCDFYNQTLEGFAEKTSDNTLLLYRITKPHLKALKPNPQSEIVYICPRQNFVAELRKAIEYCKRQA